MLDWLKKKSRRGAPSSDEGLQRAYPAINDAAGELLESLGSALSGTPDGHIQTDIAAAASLAGSVLLREVVPDVERHPAGLVILSDTHARQAELFRFMATIAAPGVGLGPGGWNGNVPPEHSPLLEVATMVGKIQDTLERAVARHQVPSELRAHVGALAAMKLASAGHSLGLIDEGVGKALASYYLVAGSKTVPPPLIRK